MLAAVEQTELKHGPSESGRTSLADGSAATRPCAATQHLSTAANLPLLEVSLLCLHQLCDQDNGELVQGSAQHATGSARATVSWLTVAAFVVQVCRRSSRPKLICGLGLAAGQG
jgi:hypothetical protein